MNVGELIEDGLKEVLAPGKGKAFYEKLSAPEAAIRMSLNENMLVDKSFSSTILQEVARGVDMRRYPRAKGGSALKAISEDLGLWEDQIIVGNGSDELLDLVAKVFVGGGEALIVEPTFEMYRLYVGLARGKAKPVPLREDFSLEPEDVLSAIGERTKAVFICSPNNPTGRQYKREEVMKIVEESGKLVVLDEAYADFAPQSLVRDAAKYPNLLVLRTLSKAYGLAGLRIGYGAGDSEIIEWLRAAQSPFSVNSIAQEACKLVLENKRIYNNFIMRVMEERKYLLAELQMVNGVVPYDSDANFILFRLMGDMKSSDIQKRLLAAGIEVRDRGDMPMLENCLRVTVADRESNMKFINELEQSLRGNK
jgi:histidinol-phosphate aminotransferase